MLTYADVCGRMLTYADVCRRVLTYADTAGAAGEAAGRIKSVEEKHAGMRAPPQMMQVGMNGRGLMPYDEGTSVCEA